MKKIYVDDDINEDENIDLKIINERNQHLLEIEEDISNLSEISILLSTMLNGQGECLDAVEKKLETVEQDMYVIEQSLEQALFYSNKMRNSIMDAAIIIGGISAGALGFIAGPVVGIATLVSGATISSGIVVANRKIREKKSD